MTRPRIALTVSAGQAPESIAARRRYVRALERAGAEVVEVAPGKELPSDIAGLCLSGGGDISPHEYGASDPQDVCRDVDEKRDKTELEMTRRALERDMPILGVCRGFQLLNVAFNGTLVQDINDHRSTDHVTHTITPGKGSRLARACGDQDLQVNSRHHQAVTPRELGESLEATAFVGELVEAFESTKHRWVVGVQWHPERVGSAEEGVDENAARIFGAFVAEVIRSPIGTATP
jgi:putative glutamine amidotransferase